MKDITAIENSRNVIKGARLNRETLYYTVLFGAATITAIVLLILGISYKNTSLIVYTSCLIPLFSLSCLAVLRLTLISRDTLYVEDGELVVKRFFKTEKIKLADIDKVTAVTDDKKESATVNVTHGKNVSKYTFKYFTKEEIAHLKRATSKH